MSWQLGAFTILALALAGGFAWYERQRPDARVVALVATLAAFAALGRVAFAALPNIKPTSDIVLVSGYALGGAPGFAVGALAGLSSNFFFGQGPWTPWQMAGWGATGLIGAFLAHIGPRRVNRWVLAAVCGVTGFAFTALQDVGDWVSYGDHSLTQLGVYVGKGIGFDTVHAVACVAFAVTFGPALTRSIARFALRLHVKWLPPGGAAVGILIAAVVLPVAWPAGRAAAAASPVGYLLSAQNPDGGFGQSPGGASSSLFSGWAALGLASAGYNPADVRHGGASLAGYISAGEASASDPGSIERTILALHVAGLPVGGLVARLQGDVRRDGSVSEQTNLTSFALLALRAAGASPPAAMVTWLDRQQDSDGGFNYATKDGGSDIDDTGAALEALAGTGFRGTARAVHFIDAHENRDGGYPSQPGASSNAQSTAWAVQGLVASGAPISSLGRPLNYLRSLTAPDGHVRYAAGNDQSPVWVTSEALMALQGKPLPLAPVAVAGAVARPTRHVFAHRPKASAPARRTPRRAVPAAPASLRGLAEVWGVAEALALAPIG
jgi:energy-coupling factor transport system substrate-specific component